MKIQHIFLIASVLCALFSDKIDRTFHGNRKIRRVILACAAGSALVTLIPLLF